MSAPMPIIESQVELPRFRTKDGATCIELSRIICLRAQLNYTMFQLTDGEQIVTSLSLSEYAALLEPYGFVRLHKNCLVNGDFLAKSILREGGSMLSLPGGEKLPVARRRRREIKLKLKFQSFCRKL